MLKMVGLRICYFFVGCALLVGLINGDDCDSFRTPALTDPQAMTCTSRGVMVLFVAKSRDAGKPEDVAVDNFALRFFKSRAAARIVYFIYSSPGTPQELAGKEVDACNKYLGVEDEDKK